MKVIKKKIEYKASSIIYLMKYDQKFVHNSIKYFHHHDQLYSHSLHIAIYSMNIGNILEYTQKQLMQIGTASLLIDIGYKKIPYEIINKTSALT